MSDRHHRKGAHSTPCPECGRWTAVTRAGQLKTHRPVADVFAGPVCPGSGSDVRGTA